jgi:hypothetical protein
MLRSQSLGALIVSLFLFAWLGGCSDSSSPGVQDPFELILAGGAGDQTATDVAGDGSAIYVSGPGVLAKFDPNAQAVDWIQTGDVGIYGVAIGPGNVFVAGRAPAGRSSSPGPCGTIDDVGDIEPKVVAGVYDIFGSLLGCESRVLYPYSGFENYWAATSASGKFFAGGHAQQAGVADGFPFVVARYDASGAFDVATTEPELELGTTTGCCTGESIVLGLGEADGDVLAAGASRLPGSGEDDVLRPMVMRYTSDLVRLWKGRSSDRVGRFLDAAEVGGAVYAVGETEGTGLFLIEKYDATGSRLWSVESSSPGVLQGVVGVGGRVFGIGTTSDSSFGGSDAVVVEFDPKDGSTLSTIYLGGAQDDAAVGAVVIASDLWVAGSTRSYASDDGNVVGQADLVLWRVTLN